MPLSLKPVACNLDVIYTILSLVGNTRFFGARVFTFNLGGFILKTKTTITERGYIIETEETNAYVIASHVKELEVALAYLPSRRGAGGSLPKPIQASHAADNQTMLAFVASQAFARARTYLQDHIGTLSVRDARAALTRLIKAGELELRDATFINAAGKERPMQGVFFTEVPEAVAPDAELPKTTFGL